MEKLPIELLSRIMVYVVCRMDIEPEQCCADYITEDTGDYDEFWLPVIKTNPQVFGPLQIGMVCRFWKSVSESTPPLWSRIAVSIDNTDDLNISKTMRDLSIRLSRSRAAPLDILVTYCGDISPKYENLNRHTIMVLDKLHYHSERFSSISLQLPVDFWAPLEYYRKSSPRLTHFRLVDESYAVGLQNHDVKTFWPALTHLTLESVHFGNISINLANLTCLKLIHARIPLPWKEIDNAHQLTHLVLDNCSIGHAESLVDQPTVTLHCVKHFEYNPGLHSEPVDFMQILICPSLECLILRDETYNPGYFIDNLHSHSFLSACASPLRRIVLNEAQRERRHPPDCDALVSSLSLLSALEYLELGLTNMPHSYFNPLLARLAESEGQSSVIFLPKLQTLKFNSLHGIFWPLIPSIFRPTGSLDLRPLRQLVIKNVVAINAESLTVDIMDELMILLDNGIDFVFYDEEGKSLDLKNSAHR